jgi:hypothetical protein
VSTSDAPVEQEVLGLYLIRGDNMWIPTISVTVWVTLGAELFPITLGRHSAVIGEVEEILDSQIDFNAVRAEPLKPVVHWAQRPAPSADALPFAAAINASSRASTVRLLRIRGVCCVNADAGPLTRIWGIFLLSNF